MNSENSPTGPVPSATFPTRLVILGSIAVSLLAIGYFLLKPRRADAQETIVTGQNRFVPGGPAPVRVHVRQRPSLKPIEGAVVTGSLMVSNRTQAELGEHRTVKDGCLAAPMEVPAVPPGEYQLLLKVRSRFGRDEILRKVVVQPSRQIAVSTDRPLYRPGQTIHLRALVQDAGTRRPVDGERLTFEVNDGRGNKVFKEARATSKHGIASADFQLANEVNEGRFAVRAFSAAVAAERSVEAREYVLPKFRVRLELDQTYAPPGGTFRGLVHAEYFFGKPAANAAAKLELRDESGQVARSFDGRAGQDGSCAFVLEAPSGLIGWGKPERLELVAEVEDSTGAIATGSATVFCAAGKLTIEAAPENGVLAPGVENQVYVMAKRVDGMPASCKVRALGREAMTDTNGLAILAVNPVETAGITIEAADQAGNRAQFELPAPLKHGPRLIVRTARGSVEAGGTSEVEIVSKEAGAQVFLDLVQTGRTVLNATVPLRDGVGKHLLKLPAGVSGMAELRAYVFGEYSEERAVARKLFIEPAGELKIRATLDKTSHEPGGVARMEFDVTDGKGNPVGAALGVNIVDEVLLAIGEKGDAGRAGNPSVAIAQLALAHSRELKERGRFEESDPHIQKMANRLRGMEGTRELERYRMIPEYEKVFQILEGGSSHSLWAATGPAKEWRHEAARKARVALAKKIATTAVLLLAALAPFILIIRQLEAGGLHSEALTDERWREHVKVGGLLYSALGGLVLLPFVLYPAGGFLLGFHSAKDWWLLLTIESCAVVLTMYFQNRWISRLDWTGLEGCRSALKSTLLGFLGQFVVLRGGFPLLFGTRAEELLVLWVLASAIAPILLLAALRAEANWHFGRVLKVDRPFRQGFLQAATVLAALLFLGMMLLPSLAKAKARSSSVALGNDLKNLELAARIAESERGESVANEPRVRRNFPETLYWNPEVITDDQGKAAIEIPLADSITTWRAAIDGIGAAGQTSATNLALRVFQDFFVDLNLPASLTLGDEMVAPIVCHNYLNEAQTIRLSMAAGDWFATDTLERTVQLAAGEVRSVPCTIQVRKAGKHRIRVMGKGTQGSDAIEREIEVIPSGQKIEQVWNEMLQGEMTQTFEIPPEAIENSAGLQVKLFPSRLSEFVEGIEGMFREPHGCFEQTSSTTYPNVLALAYLKRHGRVAPEIEMKARKHINQGYQRLLTFEAREGGFGWFPGSGAHVGLTAYGVMEFTDMSRVHSVDEGMMQRARTWLWSQQNGDGSWNPGQGLNSWAGRPLITAYIAWALAEAGDRSLALDKALQFLRSEACRLSTVYEKALAANALLARDRADDFGQKLLREIQKSAVSAGGMTHWKSDGMSMTYSRGPGMEVETTALCAMALMKGGGWQGLAKEALAWLSRQKSGKGAWGSTQATILALRALLLGSEGADSSWLPTDVAVAINGQEVANIHIEKENSDLLRQVDLTPYLRPGPNRIELRQSSPGELAVQMAGRYWTAAKEKAKSPLRLDVSYGRTKLRVGEAIYCTAEAASAERIDMAILSLEIPAGFEVDHADFEQMRRSGTIARWESREGTVTLYLKELDPKAPFRERFTLRALQPITTVTQPSVAYGYYQPELKASSEPTRLVVTGWR